MTARFVWYAQRAEALVTTIPQRAHDFAAVQAAGIAAKAVGSKGTGALARDVSRPRRVGFMRTLVGSDLPYAAIQNSGGVIRPRNAARLLIRAPRAGTRAGAGGDIVASADEVTIFPKRYLHAALAAFPGLYQATLRRMMPR